MIPDDKTIPRNVEAFAVGRCSNGVTSIVAKAHDGTLWTTDLRDGYDPAGAEWSQVAPLPRIEAKAVAK